MLMKLQDFHFLHSSAGSDRPWIVFLHGLLGSAANWRRVTPLFSKNYNVLALDQRGHGKSFKPTKGFTPKDFARDLKFIFDELKIPKAIVVGHSMGGRNAIAFAALYPELVTKL